MREALLCDILTLINHVDQQNQRPTKITWCYNSMVFVVKGATTRYMVSQQ